MVQLKYNKINQKVTMMEMDTNMKKNKKLLKNPRIMIINMELVIEKRIFHQFLLKFQFEI
jgi:hypothetical protein